MEMRTGLIVIGLVIWLAVYGFTVLMAAYQYEVTRETPAPALAVLACKAAPFLIAILFNLVISLRYERAPTDLAFSLTLSLLVTWIIVTLARKQLRKKK